MTQEKPEAAISLKKVGKGLMAKMTVSAPEEQVWRILTAFEDMARHLSSVEQSKVLHRQGKHLLLEQRSRVEVPLVPFSVRVVLDVLEERPFLYFSQREGSFTEFGGYWKVDSSPDQKESRITYYLEVGLRGGLRKWAAEKQLRWMIRRNCEDLSNWIHEDQSST